MRLCPTVEGSASPLITHRIGVDVCLARQRTFFHKCHRCIYRGQAANWEPEVAPMPMLHGLAPIEPMMADEVAAMAAPIVPTTATGKNGVANRTGSAGSAAKKGLAKSKRAAAKSAETAG